jgi:hypothetical protein
VAKSFLHEDMATVERLYIVDGAAGSSSYNVQPVEDVICSVTVGLAALGSTVAVDRHFGEYRELRPYQAPSGWAGRKILNDASVSILLEEDINEIAKRLDLTGIHEDPNSKIIEAFAGNIVLGTGLASDYQLLKQYLGAGTRLYVGQPEDGTILSITESILPCAKPAKILFDNLGIEGDFGAFKDQLKEASYELRGYRGAIMSAGGILLGDSVALQLPIDHRVMLPGWDKELASSRYLGLGISDIGRLAELSCQSVSDISRAVEASEPIIVDPGDIDKPHKLNEVLLLCGISEVSWPEQIALLPGWNGNDQVKPDRQLVTEGLSAAEYIWTSAYWSLNIEGDEDDQVEGEFVFSNGQGLALYVKIFRAFDTVYDEDIIDEEGNFDEQGESSIVLSTPKVKVIIRHATPEFGTINENDNK